MALEIKKRGIKDFSYNSDTIVIHRNNFKAFFIDAYRIPSSSMKNTLIEGDFVIVNKASYSNFNSGIQIPFDKRLNFLNLNCCHTGKPTME